MTMLKDLLGEGLTEKLMNQMEIELIGVALGVTKEAPTATAIIRVLFASWCEDTGEKISDAECVRPTLTPPTLEIEWKDKSREKTIVPLPWNPEEAKQKTTLI